MTTIIKNLFTNKADYKAFRAAWTLAVNHPDAKSKVVGDSREKGWISPTHHILFNHLCGKPLSNGFTVITNTKKLANGMIANQAYDSAYRSFSDYWLPIFEKASGKRELHKFDRKPDIDKKVDQLLSPILFFNPELRNILLQAVIAEKQK